MIAHSQEFKDKIKQMGRQLDSKVTFGETVLGNEQLNAVTPVLQSSLLKSVMKELDVDSNVSIPVGTTINYKFGVLLDSGDYEYLDFGNYIVKEIEKQEDNNAYNIVAYDKMLFSMKEYKELRSSSILNKQFPMTVRDYLECICNDIGLTFVNTKDNFANYDKIIESDLYANLGYTYRDILDELAQVTASNIIINDKDQVEIKYITDTEDTIDEEYLKDINVAFGEKYGPINSIVLSRAGESDNVYLQDEQSVADNGLCEIKISENQIMNFNDRDKYLPDILEKLNGIEYYINDFSSTGICYYEVADRYNVKVGENTYSCVMFNDEIDITQGLAETIHTDLSEQAETDYTKADKTDRRINQTYLIVDKQNQKIEGLITNIEGNTEKIAQLEATTDGIKTSVSTVEKDLATTNSNLEQTNKNVDALSGKIDGVSADFTDFKDNEYVKSIENLQDQIDGAIQFWNGSAIPTINNYPANEWTTENDRNNHRADIYTVIEDVNGELKQGKSYRFDKVGDTWQWIELTDNELSAVQALAQQALDKSNKNADDIGVLNKKASEFEQTDSEIKASVEELNNRYEQDITTKKIITGYPLVVEDAGQYDVEELKVYGNSEQDTRSDKNKFAITQGGSGYGITATYNEDGTFNFKGTASSSASTDGSTLLSHYFTFDEMGVENGKTYTISSNKTIPEGLGVRFEVYNESDSGAYTWVRVVIGQMDNARPVRYGTLNTEGGNRIRLSFQVFKDAVIDIENIGFQIEEGTVATDWQPYGAMPSPEFPSEIRNVEPIENIFFTDIWEKKIFSSNLPVGADASQYITINSFDGNNVNFTINQNEWLEVISKPIKLKPNTKYQIFYERNNSDNTDITRCFIYNYNINNSKYSINRIGVESGNNKYSFDFTTNSDDYIVIGFAVGDASTDRICNIKNIMISEENSSYVPYGNWLKGKINGNNLLNINDIVLRNSGASLEVDQNTFTLNNANSGANNYVWVNIPVEVGETYTIGYSDMGGVADNSNNRLQYSFSDIKIDSYSADIFGNQTMVNKTDKCSTSIAAGKYLILTFRIGNGSNYTITDVQVENGDNATEYEPYKEKEFLYDMNKYDEEGNVVGYYELSKINERKDDLNFISGILNKKAGKIVLTGNENWITTDKYSPGVMRHSLYNFATNAKSASEYLSNYFTGYINNPLHPKHNVAGNGYIGGSKELIFHVDLNSDLSTTESWNSWLKEKYNSGNPVVVYFQLETPEQIQLNPINVELFEGYNRITLEDKYGVVEELEMTYLTDSKLNGQYATKTELKIESDKISSEVNKKVSTDNFNSTVSDLDSKITQTANNIKSEVSSTYSTKTEVVQAKNDAISSANSSTDGKLKDYSKTTDMNKAIDGAKNDAISSANSSTDNKLKSYSTTTQMNSAINQKADEISLEVSKKISNDDGGVELASLIRQTAELIYLQANNFGWKSDNSEMTTDGKLTVNDGEFKGNINTNKDVVIGNNLYIGYEQLPTNNHRKIISFTDNSYIERLLSVAGDLENLNILSPNLTLKGGHFEYGDTQNFHIDLNESNITFYYDYEISEGQPVTIFLGQISNDHFYFNPPGTGVYVGGSDNHLSLIGGNSRIDLEQDKISLSRQPSIVSDKRLKTKIKNIDVDWIDKLKIKEFEYKNSRNKKQIGLIAQDYVDEEYSKYFLDEDDNGYYSISYGNINNALIQYCQQMKKQINQQQTIIEKLEQRIYTLENKK